MGLDGTSSLWEGILSVQDLVASSKITPVPVSVRGNNIVDALHHEKNQLIGMTMPFSFNDKLCRVETETLECCNESHEDANTAECSTSSGESFTPANLHAMMARYSDQTLAKYNCRQRGILRLESKISEPQEKPPHRRKRKVHFGTVSVRDYDVILGDHPCCSYGPPLSLDWNFNQQEPIDVNAYEFENIPFRRKSLRGLTLNYYQRKHLLSDYSESDFKAAKKEIKRIKSNRYITMKLACFHPVEAAIESARRKLKKLPKIREEGP
eukprot:885931_1